jgi:hypothetical protein
LCSPSSSVQVLAPNTLQVTGFGDGAYATWAKDQITSLGWGLVQSDGCSYRKRSGHRIQRNDCVRAQGLYHLQAMERGFGKGPMTP